MKLAKKMVIVILIVFIAMQFIRPARNQSTRILPTDITQVAAVPPAVLAVLKKACYDCHSNNTIYPWYMNVQPAAWFMAHHVKEGRHDLNFSEFGAYSKRKQQHKLQSVAEQVREGEMPISSYRLMHAAARLSSEEKALIISWADSLASKD